MRLVNLKAVEDLKKAMAVEFEEISKTVSMRRVVQELLPEIRAAIERSYSLSEVAKYINKRIPINEGTLRGSMYGKDRVDRAKTGSKKKRVN